MTYSLKQAQYLRLIGNIYYFRFRLNSNKVILKSLRTSNLAQAKFQALVLAQQYKTTKRIFMPPKQKEIVITGADKDGNLTLEWIEKDYTEAIQAAPATILQQASQQVFYSPTLEAAPTFADKSVDMFLCDPPYGMSYQSNYRKEKYDKIANDSNLHWLPNFFSEMHRIAKDNTAHYVFCSWHQVDVFKIAAAQHFTVKNILIWNKNNFGAGDLTGDYSPKYEMILFLHKGRCLRQKDQKRLPNVLEFKKTNNVLHPTQKPVDLFSTLIEQFCIKDDVVCDPFAGSGTTAIACENTGRKWICIEQNKEYASKAIERIRSNP